MRKMTELAELLKAARKQAGLTYRAASEASGVSYATICDNENGRFIPRARNLSRLARAYGLPSGYFRQARNKALAMREARKLRLGTRQFRRSDIIKRTGAKSTFWRVLRVLEDGRLEVEKVIQPPRKTINRPESYEVVKRGGVSD